MTNERIDKLVSYMSGKETTREFDNKMKQNKFEFLRHMDIMTLKSCDDMPLMPNINLKIAKVMYHDTFNSVSYILVIELETGTQYILSESEDYHQMICKMEGINELYTLFEKK